MHHAKVYSLKTQREGLSYATEETALKAKPQAEKHTHQFLPLAEALRDEATTHSSIKPNKGSRLLKEHGSSSNNA